MEFLASLVVHKPLNIFLVAMLFAAGFLVCRFAVGGAETHAGALLVAAAGWALYAAWEWLVMVRAPAANIRVDLVVIWPLLLVLSVWSVIRAIR